MSDLINNFKNIETGGWRIPLVTQSAITCSKLAIETLEQGMKYVQS